jgi:hypothetical protein
MNPSTRALAFIASLAMLTQALPARAADAPPFAWLGVTIGAPAAPLRQTLGDPLLLTGFNDAAPPYRAARYELEGTTILLLVTEAWGRVSGLQAFVRETPESPISMPPDPSGIVLGQTIEEVVAKHPRAQRSVEGDWVWLVETVSGHPDIKVAYKFFLTGRLVSIGYLRTSSSGAKPPSDALPALAEAAGDSYENAIVDGQKHEMTGVDWEYLYLALHPCAPNQRWKTQRQSLQRHENRVYDVLHVACPSTNVERDYFFDITSYYGNV